MRGISTCDAIYIYKFIYVNLYITVTLNINLRSREKNTKNIGEIYQRLSVLQCVFAFNFSLIFTNFAIKNYLRF